MLHSILVLPPPPGDTSALLLDRTARVLLEYATLATPLGDLKVALYTLPLLGTACTVLQPSPPVALVHLLLSGAGAAALRALDERPTGPDLIDSLASAIGTACDFPGASPAAVAHLVSVVCFGPWAMPSPRLQSALERCFRLDEGPSTTRVEFVRLVCDASPGQACCELAVSSAATLSGERALHAQRGSNHVWGSLGFESFPLPKVPAAPACAPLPFRGGGEAVRAFLRQSTRALPPGTQSGAATDWLHNLRAPMLAPGPLPASLPISPLRSLPLIAAMQVSVGPTTLVALAHTWLALAAPLHMCTISTAVAAANATRSSTLDGQWWRECDGPPAAASAELTSDAADADVAWPAGWRDGSCASVGCLPVLLRSAGGTVCSLDSLASRIRIAVAALGERHAAELSEQRASGRPVKQQARWKGKAAETAAAARVDVHYCWQAIADAVLTAPPSELRAVGLVQLSTLPLQYLAGGCFEVLVPPVMSSGEGASCEASAATERAKAAREASVAWLELLVGLTAIGCGVLLRGADIEMPLSCAGGGSLRGSVAGVPTVTAWYILVPEDSAAEGSDSYAPESAIQGLIYRLVTRDGMAGAAACTALGLRVHAPCRSDGVISSGGGPFAGTGLLPASKLSASAFSGVLTAPSSPASVAVGAMLKCLQIAGPLNPLDLSAGVGPGHRALVLRVELAAAFASAVVGAGLLDVLQPSASGGAARSRTVKVGPSTSAPHPSGSEEGNDEDHDALHEVSQAGKPGGVVPSAARGAPVVKPRAAMAHEPPPAAAAVLAKLVRSRLQGGNSTGGRSPSPGASSGVPVAAARLGPSRAPRGPAQGRQRPGPDPTLVHAERTSISDAFFEGAGDRGDPDVDGATSPPRRASVPSDSLRSDLLRGQTSHLPQPGSYTSPDCAFEVGSEDEDESSMLPGLDLPTLLKLYSSSVEGAIMDDASASLAGASCSPLLAASTAADAHASDARAAVPGAAHPVADSIDASARHRGFELGRGAGLPREKAQVPCALPPPHFRHNIDPAIAGLLGHAGSAQILHGPRLQNVRYVPDLESEHEGLGSGADSAGASDFDFFK